MAQIFEFLKGSDDPAYDQLIFMKAQIAFWLLGAIDGHAKNFSVFLHPGPGFQLAPLYDVMSVQHLMDDKSLQRKNMKLAMSVGSNNHYQVHGVQSRHFRQTAEQAGLAEGMVEIALAQISETLPDAIAAVCKALPDDFPEALRDSIAAGALKRNEIITEAVA